MRRYPGLAPFTYDQKDVFFGRENDIQELSELIFVERKVLLYSKSGYGKTSLLNAGVMPKLSDNKDFEFISVRFRSYTEESSSPNQTFLQTLRQHADFKFSDEHETIIDKYAKEYIENHWSIFKRNQLLGNKHKTYILIFDQFEELFTYPETQINEFKQRFAEIILENNLPDFFNGFEDAVFDNKDTISKEEIDLLYRSINIKAVFAIRSDRLSMLNYLADTIPDIQKVFYELKQFSIEQAKKAILQPSQYNGYYESEKYTYTEQTVNKIISFLTNDFEQKEVETTQLQLICQKLEEKVIYQAKTSGKKAEIVINEKELPKFSDLFLQFYKDAIGQLNLDEREKAKRFIEFELIKKQRRITVDRTTCEQHISKEALIKLENIHLIRREQTGEKRYSYELSHDTLVEPIDSEAEKRREKEENERLKARQRKLIRIIAISIIVAAFSIGAAIYGRIQKRNVENEKIKTEKALDDLEEAQRLRDSTNYQLYMNKANTEIEKGNINDAVQNLEVAKKFTNDTTEVMQKIKTYILIGKDILTVDSLIEEGIKQTRTKDYSKAIEAYKKAFAIGINLKNQKIKENAVKLKDVLIYIQNDYERLRDAYKESPEKYELYLEYRDKVIKIQSLINELQKSFNI